MLGRRRYQSGFSRSKKRMELERMADRKLPRSPKRTEEEIRLTRRSFVFKGLALTSFAALTGRLWQLQIRDYSQAIGDQEAYSRRLFYLSPSRGLIYDRDHMLLADNVKSWAVGIVPAALPDDSTARGKADREAIFTMLTKHLGLADIVTVRPGELPKDPALRSEIYYRLAAALGIDVESIRAPVEGALEKAAANRISAPGPVKVPQSKDDLRPDQLAAARELQRAIEGIYVVNPIAFQIAPNETYRPYDLVTIKRDVPKEVALGIEANRLYLPGVQVSDSALRRRYAVGEELGHVLGYVGPITDEEYEEYLLRDEKGQPIYNSENEAIHIYRKDEFLGKAGLEAGLEELLRGRRGSYVAKVNANERIVGEFADERVNPVNGSNVVLTIPLDYQRQAITILQSGIDAVKPFLEGENERHRAEQRPDRVRPIPVPAGAVVALDPRNGEVLALVSLPGYDPRHFAEGITQKQLDLYLEKGIPDDRKRHPLQNRTVANVFPPGSTLKSFIAAAALQEQVIKLETKFKCLGHISIPATYNELQQSKYWCWTRDASHQELDIREALATSCDVFFYNVGGPEQRDELGNMTRYYQPGVAEPQFFHGLGIDRINQYLKDFGFGAPTGIELGDEVKGVVPGPDWKEANFPGNYWSLGDTIVTAIGQGYDLSTPLQLCNATAAIANRGTLFKPTLIHEILDEAGKTIRGPQSQVLRRLRVDPRHLDVVRQGMQMNITWHRDNNVKGLVAPKFDEKGNPIPGTEQFPLPPGVDAGVKTGTAEYGTDTDNEGLLLRAHAWCAAFAPFNNPEIAVVAFVEGGSASATIAAPIVSAMINAWFARKR